MSIPLVTPTPSLTAAFPATSDLSCPGGKKVDGVAVVTENEVAAAEREVAGEGNPIGGGGGNCL